ncbi:MAG: hypothetical protein VB095_04545 [Anaerovorax sp.]|nr:hypothetical protein [Anaerovorax sp.]
MVNKKILIASAIVGFGTAATFLYYRFMPRVPLKKYTKLCLTFAIMDDEIVRNELDGNFIQGKEIEFPPKDESIVYRYQLFLEMYKKYSRKELENERIRLIQRLEESKQYLDAPQEELELEFM